MAIRELDNPPGMLQLFARAGVGSLPGTSRLPLVGGSRGSEVPDVTLVLRDLEVDPDRLASYA